MKKCGVARFKNSGVGSIRRSMSMSTHEGQQLNALAAGDDGSLARLQRSGGAVVARLKVGDGRKGGGA